MIGILFATEMEARPFLERGEPEDTVTVISGRGMEAARVATEKLIKEQGCTAIINAGVCGALNNRLERGAVYRVSMVSTEHLKAAVNVGVGIGLKRLVTVEEPVACVVRTHDAEPSTGVLELDLESFHLADEDRFACGIVSGDSAHFHEVADFESTLHGDRQVRVSELDFARRRQIHLGLDLDATYLIRELRENRDAVDEDSQDEIRRVHDVEGHRY